jgi:pimeloyl-ACP methyl ester carboxylesterase
VATSDGRRLTVREGGDPAGFPVLFIPGTPGSGLIYEPHARDAVERGIRLFSYDRPGYGDSTRQKGRKVADCTADIEAVCDALGVERLCVWGISGGGPYALAAAALLPERVIAAATLASLAPYDADGFDFFEGMDEETEKRWRTVFEGEDVERTLHEKQRHEVLSLTPGQLMEVSKPELAPSPDREVLTREFATYYLDTVRAAIGATVDGWFDERVAFTSSWGYDLATIRVPVQLWHGEQDDSVPYAHGVWLAAHIPGVDAQLTAGDGHLTLFARRIPEVHRWLLERAAFATETAPT